MSITLMSKLAVTIATILSTQSVAICQLPNDSSTVEESAVTMLDQLEAASPDWVNEGNKTIEGEYFVVVQSDPFFDPFAAKSSLSEKMVESVEQTLDKWIKPGAGRLLGFDSEFIDKNLRVNEKTTVVSIDNPIDLKDDDYGKMHFAFTQLKFDDQFRDHATEVWKKFETRSRLKQTGLIGGGVLFLLFAFFAFFKADNASRGFYTRRLLLFTLFLVVAGVAVWLYTSGQFMWL